MQFDDEVDQHLNEIMNRLKAMGIRHVSRPMALNVIIQMNKAADIKLKRRRRSREGLIFI